MSSAGKLEKAKRLVELTGVGRGIATRRSLSVDEPVDGPRSVLEAQTIEMQIELRAKYMTEEQLDALLEFYGSDMGRSILEAQKRIQVETSKLIVRRMNNTNTGATWLIDPDNENHT